MFPWSIKRKLLYTSAALVVLIFLIGLPTFFIVHKAPSCFDAIKNQGEQGTDCGGPCTILCRADALSPIIHWQRFFQAKKGVYNLLAYIENPNLNSAISNVPYIFKLYDKNNLLIYERRGETFVPAKKIFGVFESNIVTGDSLPTRAFFEFLGNLEWRKDFSKDPVLLFTDETISNASTSPRLTARVENSSLHPLYNIEVIAILYDVSDNAIAASRTVLDVIEKAGSTPVTFTWSRAFSTSDIHLEFLYRFLR